MNLKQIGTHRIQNYPKPVDGDGNVKTIGQQHGQGHGQKARAIVTRRRTRGGDCLVGVLSRCWRHLSCQRCHCSCCRCRQCKGACHKDDSLLLMRRRLSCRPVVGVGVGVGISVVPSVVTLT